MIIELRIWNDKKLKFVPRWRRTNSTVTTKQSDPIENFPRVEKIISVHTYVALDKVVIYAE